MRSLIHLFKLRKNQVLSILLIICIFLDVAFLLLLCLTDWYHFNQNGWSCVSKNLFYKSVQKIRWPGRKETSYLSPTAGGVAG